MSKKRRNFTARFKADLVLEVLKGEKELNVIATENNIQPNLLLFIAQYNYQKLQSEMENIASPKWRKLQRIF